ncbi:MAG: nucleoside transporter C-terminal domain-containing protein [Verrucomicrobiota bacterium]|nr:nucleoside transporter C-terminal domain-containing protein [Verrucomicrobiota bacterium]
MGMLNHVAGWNVDWSLKGLLGYPFYPITLALGVCPSDALPVAKIIGERTFATEVAGHRVRGSAPPPVPAVAHALDASGPRAREWDRRYCSISRASAL